jgi:tetratricopeptide (TPR) repeat protein
MQRKEIASLIIVWGALVVVVVGIFAVSYARPYVVAQREDMMFSAAPSPERAYAYGARHFDAQHAADYDIERAEYYFNWAERLDLDYPHVQHQLARIAFLKGDFDTALMRIDRELESPTHSPSAYYIRGLIKGFMGDYAGAVIDYQTYREYDPNNWAAVTDLSWVLLKDDRPEEALLVLSQVLEQWPHNPWLLNTKAIALYEVGRVEEAREAITAAAEAVKNVTPEEWLRAYPGNDPLAAPDGVKTFQESVSLNMHTMFLARAESGN